MSKSNPLERAFKILDIVASSDREMSLIEIVNASKLPQSSTFRLASNLVESGMLSFDSGTKTYSVGSRANRLSMFISHEKSLKAILGPVLETLAHDTGETGFFVSASDNGNKLLDYSVPQRGANIFIHPGFEFPMNATAAGKVIQAFSQNTEIPQDVELKSYQPNTVVDRERLAVVFQEVRLSGYAINDSELDKDVFSVCVPVPIGNLVTGALGIVGPTNRMFENDEHDVCQLINRLKKAAVEISTLLA